ncbi:MAG TPA: class I SAM-dependent methyltransferase [candidate division Zixibacteria bacterium]|nr:class I SAM-dependent methyltransferase [candidate division Zixibacteria bacterium]
MQYEKPWYDNDDVWAKVEPVLFNTVSIGNAARQIDNIIQLIDLKTEMRILDLCSGVGRHSLELARRGYRVTAVDRTIHYLDRAKAMASAEKLDVEFIQEDMRTFRRPHTYDVILNISTSFGYFENPENDVTVIRNIYESLKDGGILLFEMNGKEINARNFSERDWDMIDDLIVAEERKVIGDWESIDLRWVIMDPKEGYVNDVKMNVRLYSAGELKRLLLDNGFREAKAYGSLEGIPYDHQARRMVVVARK